MSDYLNKIKKIITERTGIDKEELLTSSYFEGDLNIGEMELIEIISELEETYHVDLSEMSKNFETIQDIADALEEII